MLRVLWSHRRAHYSSFKMQHPSFDIVMSPDITMHADDLKTNELVESSDLAAPIDSHVADLSVGESRKDGGRRRSPWSKSCYAVMLGFRNDGTMKKRLHNCFNSNKCDEPKYHTGAGYYRVHESSGCGYCPPGQRPKVLVEASGPGTVKYWKRHPAWFRKDGTMKPHIGCKLITKYFLSPFPNLADLQEKGSKAHYYTTDGKLSYAQSKAKCESHGFLLCSRATLCPDGHTGGEKPVGGPQSTSQWGPVSDSDNAWVSLGGHWPSCQLHTKNAGGAHGKPGWGTTSNYKNYRTKLPCCTHTTYGYRSVSPSPRHPVQEGVYKWQPELTSAPFHLFKHGHEGAGLFMATCSVFKVTVCSQERTQRRIRRIPRFRSKRRLKRHGSRKQQQHCATSKLVLFKHLTIGGGTEQPASRFCKWNDDAKLPKPTKCNQKFKIHELPKQFQNFHAKMNFCKFAAMSA